MSGITIPSPSEAGRRWPTFRGSRLRWPERLVAISAVVLMVSLVGLSWFTFPPRPSGGAGLKYYVLGNSEDGWHGLSGAHWLLLVTVLAALALFFCQAMLRAPAVPVTLSLAVMFLGGLSTIWLIVRVLIDPPAGRDFGGWLGLMAVAVLTAAGYKSLRMEGIAPEDGPGEVATVSAQELAGAQEPERGSHS